MNDTEGKKTMVDTEHQVRDAIASTTEAEAIAIAEDHENWAQIWRSIAAAKATQRAPATRPAHRTASMPATPGAQASSPEPPEEGSVRFQILTVMRDHPHRRWRFSEIANRIPTRRNQTVANTLKRMLATGEVTRPDQGIYVLREGAQDPPRLTDEIEDGA